MSTPSLSHYKYWFALPNIGEKLFTSDALQTPDEGVCIPIVYWLGMRV